MTPGNHLAVGFVSHTVLCTARGRCRDSYHDGNDGLQPDGEHYVDQQVSAAAGHDCYSNGRNCICRGISSRLRTCVSGLHGLKKLMKPTAIPVTPSIFACLRVRGWGGELRLSMLNCGFLYPKCVARASRLWFLAVTLKLDCLHIRLAGATGPMT